ncbi:MAG: glycoside hydrolase family 13 protein [Symbiobacteriaceae bacterium]|nr:glycoside hydrolase family 13 protein [Symbiobacteriaceae bacterium]
MYYFDEFHERCRTPQGALPVGADLQLTLRYRRGLCCQAWLYWKIDGGETGNLAMEWQGMEGIDDLFSVTLAPDSTGLYWYWFSIETAEGSFYIDRQGPGANPTDPYQFTLHAAHLETPDWIKGGVMYHIFVDRFAKGGASELPLRGDAVRRRDWGGTPFFAPDDNGIVPNKDFFGGNLEGIMAKLPYLQEQGVTCLYLSPIFEAASNHKYDTGNFHRIDAGFGDDRTLRALCQEAKKYGMAVILDGVFSHVGSDSLYFNKEGNYSTLGAYQSLASPYASWFTFTKWPEAYLCWWDILLLPTIAKYDNSYRDFINEVGGVIDHWMECGIAGWRLDVVDELPDAFLNPLCAAVRRTNPHALLIGEVWEDASNKVAYGVRRQYFLGGQLDSVMNYPLKNAIIAYLREGKVEFLAQTMATITQNYPQPVLHTLMNILGTHDTMRILTVLGGDDFPTSKEEMQHYRLSDWQLARGKQLLRIAAALQFTLPGFPCVYYGDEVGMEGGADPFNRVCFPWGKEDVELQSWYRRLAQLRQEYPVLREGEYRLMKAREGVFAFTRGEGEDCLLIASNINKEAVVLPFPDFTYHILHQRHLSTCLVPPGSVAIYGRGSRANDRK